MKLHPRVTRSAVELVKRFEGLRRRAARLPDGGWTIGYGHTVSAREGAVVSPEDAEALLYYDLSEVADKVEAWTFTPLNQNQFEALTAFTFNIGTENFRRSTVLKRVNEGQHLMAAAALELWRKADFGGEDLVIDALVRRRAAEKAHYLTPPEGFTPSPTPVLKPTFDHSVIEAAVHSRAGRPAAIVDAPMDGDTATATVRGAAEPEDLKQTAFPFVAASAGGMATARLHQLFPEKAIENDAQPEPEAPPFALEEEHHAAPEALNDTPSTSGNGDEAAPLQIPTPMFAPPPPPVTGFSGFTPPPVRQFETAPSLQAVPQASASTQAPLSAAQSQDAAEPVLEPESLFDAPSSRPFAGFEREQSVSLRRPAAVESTFDDTLDEPGAFEGVRSEHSRPGALHNRSLIYFSIGLLGVALFAAALFSMFSGKASPVNLVIGLMGILFMTPAGGYFLLRFLNKRDGLVDGQTS